MQVWTYLEAKRCVHCTSRKRLATQLVESNDTKVMLRHWCTECSMVTCETTVQSFKPKAQA